MWISNHNLPQCDLSKALEKSLAFWVARERFSIEMEKLDIHDTAAWSTTPSADG